MIDLAPARKREKIEKEQGRGRKDYAESSSLGSESLEEFKFIVADPSKMAKSLAKIRIFRFARQQPMTANLPYTAVRDLVITHPTLSEGFLFLFSAVPPVEK
ncbi:MAG TPA: hypothetical protein VK578_04260 [Edaphobacter sp.]|nr:hypothetical protein [Edaphobacter sp.]